MTKTTIAPTTATPTIAPAAPGQGLPTAALDRGPRSCVAHLMSRRWLVAVSVVAHLAIVVGLVISGIWRIDQVERGRIRSQPIGVPLPPPPPPGGQVAKSDPVKPETKGAVTVVRTPHQPKPSVVAPQPPGGDE